jgi:hypothetical protein
MKGLLVAFVFAALACAQLPSVPGGMEEQRDKKLPDGRSQTEAILKADHKRTLEDLDEIKKLLDDVRKEVDKFDYHAVSVSAVKKLEEIEKRAKRIRDRMKRR